jgi:N-acetylglucosamine kinase-like BadF-type ATPase
MDTYLGLDIGATHARWVLVDADEREVRAGHGQGLQATVQGVDEAGARLAALLAGIRAEIDDLPPPRAAVAGVAGAGDARTRRELERRVAEHLPVTVTGDPVVAAAAALAAGPGVALCSGTGSFAIARGASGALLRVGGRGPWLGDPGSAHDLVRRAAVVAVRAADGLAPATELGARLGAHFGAPDPLQLGRVLPRLPGERIAAALSVVVDCAAAGDAVAVAVLEDGTRELAALAAAAAHRAGLAPPTTEVALLGGVLESCSWVVARVARALGELGFAATRRSERDGAHGAAALARAVHLQLAPLCGWIGDGAA